MLEGTLAFGRKLTENFTYLKATDCTDLPGEMLAADSQMTTSFFMLRPRKAGFRQTDAGSLTSIFTNGAFWRVQHQITATAYLVRDDSCGSPQNCRLLAVYVSLLANILVL